MHKYIECAEHIGYKILGILDHDFFGNTRRMFDVPVIGSELKLHKSEWDELKRSCWFFCATNWFPGSDEINQRNQKKRQRQMSLLRNRNLDIASLIDPAARVSRTSRVGQGVFVDAGVMVEGQVWLQDFCSIYHNSLIGHDSIIGVNSVIQRDCVITSDVTVGFDCYLGLSAKILKSDCILGERTFVHEAIYLRRGTLPDEVVSLHGKNMRRVIGSAE